MSHSLMNIGGLRDEYRAPVAQSVEHRADTREVAGSNTGPINSRDLLITEESSPLLHIS